MPTYATCIFCGRNDSKPSREHILAKWITEQFPEAANAIWEVTDRETGKTFFKSKRYIDLITKKPCGRCNNGWMAQIEHVAKPVLVPLIHGAKVTLSPEEQAIIAIWFFKTSVMFDLHGKKLRPCYFDSDELHKLARLLACDGRYNFYLGEYRGKKDGFFQEDHLGVAFANANDESHQPIGPPVRAYSFTLLIKRLVLQILCLKRPTDRSLTYYAPDFTPASVQLSRTGEVITWPPPFYFNDTGIDDFVFRWQHIVLPPSDSS